jgi:hypothetical protein
VEEDERSADEFVHENVDQNEDADGQHAEQQEHVGHTHENPLFPGGSQGTGANVLESGELNDEDIPVESEEMDGCLTFIFSLGNSGNRVSCPFTARAWSMASKWLSM